jgi:hypothetical protein
MNTPKSYKVNIQITFIDEDTHRYEDIEYSNHKIDNSTLFITKANKQIYYPLSSIKHINIERTTPISDYTPSDICSSF